LSKVKFYVNTAQGGFAEHKKSPSLLKGFFV